MKASHIALLVTVLLGTASTASALTCKEKYELALVRALLVAPPVCSADDPTTQALGLGLRGSSPGHAWAPQSAISNAAKMIRPVDSGPGPGRTCCDWCYEEYLVTYYWCWATYHNDPLRQYCLDGAWEEWCYCNQACGGNCGWGPCNG
jgi:hypothetical protein